MDSGHGNEPGWPNNTLLTYNLSAAAKLRESVVVRLRARRSRVVKAVLSIYLLASSQC